MPDSVQGVFILIMVMPGFLGYFAFSRLYNRKLDDAIEKVSLIVLINVIAIMIAGYFVDLGVVYGVDDQNVSTRDLLLFSANYLFLLSFVAFFIGIALAAVGNWSFIGKLFWHLRLTARSSHDSVLAKMVQEYPEEYLKIRLKSGGYVIGHVKNYSIDAEESVLFLDNAARRPARREHHALQPAEYEISGPGVLLLSFDDIECVEVLWGE